MMFLHHSDCFFCIPPYQKATKRHAACVTNQDAMASPKPPNPPPEESQFDHRNPHIAG